MKRLLFALTALVICISAAPAADEETSFVSAYADLAPHPVKASTPPNPEGIAGRILCGYQGWFRCEGDGSNMGWNHYSIGVKGEGSQFRPGACSIDLWPDMTEYDPDERFPTPFRHQDGAVAEVFSSQHPKTVDRHFRWMKEYEIDGAFVQRFAVHARERQGSFDSLAADNRKLSLCRKAANEHQRVWALMYDLSGITDKDMPRLFRDWKELRTRMNIGRDPAYLHHEGKPLLAIWGAGFEGENRPSIPEISKFVDFVKNNPEFGGCSIMLGVPTGWRKQERDCIQHPELEALFAMADILSPWTVGRYQDTEQIQRHAEEYWKPDRETAAESGIDYLPVVFPGFSWHNLQRGEAPLNAIPRLKGDFFWQQVIAAKASGASALYVAMFDELDEGTAIFKCSNQPPVGDSPFSSYEGLPSDHYLKLCGKAGHLLRR